jgi:UDP-N-acetylmuramate--alanine ligase
VFFQPHLHSRTKAFFTEFVDVLKDADFVSMMPIYKARLETDLSVSSEDVRDAVIQAGGNAESLAATSDMSARIMEITDKNTVVVNIGAGNAFAELDKLTLTK